MEAFGKIRVYNMKRSIVWLSSLVLFSIAVFSPRLSHAIGSAERERRDRYWARLDDLDHLWNVYKYRYIQNGRVISWDENKITTSESQGYAMLRAVWAGDQARFDQVWNWTRLNLQIRSDKLFAWKWRGGVLDASSATDADTDIALALILASRRFGDAIYKEQAMPILDSLWRNDIVQAGRSYYVTAGDWTAADEFPRIHTAYLAPYAYTVFAQVDATRPWRDLVRSSYKVLHWIYDQKKLTLPPEMLYVNRKTGELMLEHPDTRESHAFSYDAFPIFWRVALDQRWFARPEKRLRRKMLAFFEKEWNSKKVFYDRYDLAGNPLSSLEALPLYTTVHSLALLENPKLARELQTAKIDTLWKNAAQASDTPYYLHNWLWFDRAFELKTVLHYKEFLGFLIPLDWQEFMLRMPWVILGLTVLLFFLAQFHVALRWTFLALCLYLCVRYLTWRVVDTLNFVEPAGPYISILLLLAEFYAFTTVALLLVQVGIKPESDDAPQNLPDPIPSVDVYIPIYTESLNILEKTLIGATSMIYPAKTVYVLDDGHRDEVEAMAERYGARYIRGPRHHAKAGNLNNALYMTRGDLIAVLDTDHIPSEHFLLETVPYFSDPKMGFVQTPHHFYNEDIYQHAFQTGRKVPSEQAMFHHSIQPRRGAWNGAFFAGSSAVISRKALRDIGGFKLMSITEDIHTSQHLHARGWKSEFVNKSLTVGLSAESLSAHLVQRRRWMLGTLHIFFKDNPLFCKGLSLRQRVGYFASLYYFFFPAIRVIFWATPLFFLIFHWHPLLADLPVLLAYLVPFVMALTLMSRNLLAGWPRLFWSAIHELSMSFPLARSMFDLLLPKTLGFKVTPKGVQTQKAAFDLKSSYLTIFATLLTAAGIAKGLMEVSYSGIEKDAYFFNLFWATGMFLGLLVSLILAWEKPQRRSEARVQRPVRAEIDAAPFHWNGVLNDLSVTGFSLLNSLSSRWPRQVVVALENEIELSAELVYHEALDGSQSRAGYRFLRVNRENYQRLVKLIFTRKGFWEKEHEIRHRGYDAMFGAILLGIARFFVPSQPRHRAEPRWQTLRRDAVAGGENLTVWFADFSAQGLGGFVIRRDAPQLFSMVREIQAPKRDNLRLVHRKRVLPNVWRVGFEKDPVELSHENVQNFYHPN